MSTAALKDPPTLVDIRAAVDGVVVTAWESEFLIPQQTAGGFNVPLVAATLAGMPADDHIAPGNIFQNSAVPFASTVFSTARLRTVLLSSSCVKPPGGLLDSTPAHSAVKLQEQRRLRIGFFVDDSAQDTRRLVIETNGIRQSKAETCIWRDPLRGSSIHEGRLRLAAD